MTYQQTLKQTINSCCVVSAILLSASLLQAGIVTSFDGVSGTGLASMSFNNIFTVTPNDDDVVGPSGNLIAVHQKAYNAIGVIDMEFSVADSGGAAGGGVTEYVFSEGVHNGTGIDWTDYHVQLGFGTGADFVPSLPGDGLDFDAPDFNSPYAFAPFTTIVASEDDITIFGGTFPDGIFNVFQFPLDIPDGIDSFTLRQFPTIDFQVPEPTSALLAAIGFFALIAGRRPRK